MYNEYLTHLYYMLLNLNALIRMLDSLINLSYTVLLSVDFQVFTTFLIKKSLTGTNFNLYQENGQKVTTFIDLFVIATSPRIITIFKFLIPYENISS